MYTVYSADARCKLLFGVFCTRVRFVHYIDNKCKYLVLCVVVLSPQAALYPVSQCLARLCEISVAVGSAEINVICVLLLPQ